MNTTERLQVQLDNGAKADAVAPEILSVSRRTDIPAFYADWFFGRLSKGREGYIDSINPFNQKRQHVSFKNVKFIVFWSKNPKPIMKHLDTLDALGIDWYLQYTLNDYPSMFEPNIPSIEEKVRVFKEISSRYGPSKMIWRYDPVFYIGEILGIEQHVQRIAGILNEIGSLTQKMVFSFADIARYRKVLVNLKDTGAKELTYEEQVLFAEKLRALVNDMGLSNLQIATCSEAIDLESYGIQHNACIDAKLIAQLSRDHEFSKRMSIAGKDPGQRGECLCAKARDIGVYDTCAHGCKYCYANLTPESAMANFEQFKIETNKSSLI